MESIESTSGRWGLFPWFPEHGTGMIHPEDVEALTSLSPNGKVFESMGTDGDYLVIGYGRRRFRVIPQAFRKVNSPRKRIGDVVEVESKGEVVQAVVVGIQWHYQRNEPFYVVEKNGKVSSKRYWGCDFQ